MKNIFSFTEKTLYRVHSSRFITTGQTTKTGPANVSYSMNKQLKNKNSSELGGWDCLMHGKTLALQYPGRGSRLKVREGRRAANFLKLCVFLDYTAISEHM